LRKAGKSETCRRCSHCHHEIKEVIVSRGRWLCPYCFEVIEGLPDEEWMPEIRLGDIRKDER